MKANRLRVFWELESDELVGKILSEMLELWKFINIDKKDLDASLASECERVIARLLKKPILEENNEENFLKKKFHNLSLENIQMDTGLLPIMESRLQGVHKCMQSNAPLAAIILCGSIPKGSY